ncbi:MAG: hypothetical protein WD711_10975 [Dongiaceae bacterium]
MTPRRHWLFVLACGAIMITLTMGLRQTFGLFLSPISESLGTGREMFAFAIAIQNPIWGASSPFFGALADRYEPLDHRNPGARIVAPGTVERAPTAERPLIAPAYLAQGLTRNGIRPLAVFIRAGSDAIAYVRTETLVAFAGVGYRSCSRFREISDERCHDRAQCHAR